MQVRLLVPAAMDKLHLGTAYQRRSNAKSPRVNAEGYLLVLGQLGFEYCEEFGERHFILEILGLNLDFIKELFDAGYCFFVRLIRRSRFVLSNGTMWQEQSNPHTGNEQRFGSH